MGLSDLLFASGFLGTRLAKIGWVGIQPATMEIGLELSKTIQEHFDKLLETVLEKLQEWALEMKGTQDSGNVPGDSI